MPQLDFSTFPTQWIWLAITFVVLYILMSKVALPRVGQVLEERQNRIDDNLEMAGSLKAEAESAAAAYEKSLAEARAEAQTVIKQTADQINDEASKKSDELAAKLAADVKAAEAKITQAKDTAVAGLRDVAVGVAKEVAAKLTDGSVTDKAVNSAVDAAMQEQSS
ncbi:MAG: F0F1 ATP synthase subunit B' [Rhodospirillales bacterium]|nr:F0F1 ATP synthase subunit B' [Rhodospirillales bacterium]